MRELEALVVAAYVFALDINRVAVNDVSYRCRDRCVGPTLGGNRAQPGRFRASPLAAKRTIRAWLAALVPPLPERPSETVPRPDGSQPESRVRGPRGRRAESPG
jgi:hypothetical protein